MQICCHSLFSWYWKGIFLLNSLPGEPLTLPLWVTPFCSRPPAHLFKVNLLCLASGGFKMWWQLTCLPRCPLPAEDSWSPHYHLAYSHPCLACPFTTTQLCTVFLRMTTGTNFLVLDRALSRPLLQEAFLKSCFSWNILPRDRPAFISWHFAISTSSKAYDNDKTISSLSSSKIPWKKNVHFWSSCVSLLNLT